MPLSPLSISIIVPTLREAERIGALLQSLQEQQPSADYVLQDVIVIDGGSDDGTVEAVQSFAGVTLMQHERGTARQRNAGGKLASGELLVFMDADCVAPPHFLEKVACAYRRVPFRVACPWFVAREKQLSIRAAYFLFNVLFFLGQSWLRTGSGVCIITPKSVFQATGGFNEELHLGEDIDFIRRAGWPHRHLLVPLDTSGRRFAEKGVWRLMWFYGRITPAILLGQYEKLRKVPYEAAAYSNDKM